MAIAMARGQKARGATLMSTDRMRTKVVRVRAETRCGA